MTAVRVGDPHVIAMRENDAAAQRREWDRVLAARNPAQVRSDRALVCVSAAPSPSRAKRQRKNGDEESPPGQPAGNVNPWSEHAFNAVGRIGRATVDARAC